MKQKDVDLVSKQIYNIRGCLSLAVNTEQAECFPGRYTHNDFGQSFVSTCLYGMAHKADRRCLDERKFKR